MTRREALRQARLLVSTSPLHSLHALILCLAARSLSCFLSLLFFLSFLFFVESVTSTAALVVCETLPVSDEERCTKKAKLDVAAAPPSSPSPPVVDAAAATPVLWFIHSLRLLPSCCWHGCCCRALQALHDLCCIQAVRAHHPLTIRLVHQPTVRKGCSQSK